MSNLQISQLVRLTVFVAFVTWSVPTTSLAQETVQPQTSGYYGVGSWKGGTTKDALRQSDTGTTIPMSSYVYAATKDGRLHTGLIVGSDPFGPYPGDTVTINAVLIPLIINIVMPDGSTTTFDPTQPNSCDGGISAESRFRRSPLVVESNLSFNGVRVGNVQYVNGFMRAQFWNQINGTSSDPMQSQQFIHRTQDAFSDPIRWSFAAAYTLLPFVGTSAGFIEGTGCDQYGVISDASLGYLLMNRAIPELQAQGVIAPTKFAAFLVQNVVTSFGDPISPAKCCIAGFHGATGIPAQTYGWMVYDTSGRTAAVHDISVASHEIAEWMSDPLGNNPVPAWGNIGKVSGCQGILEVGDPLYGTDLPVIRMNGYDYHVQESAFFSWFFNSDSALSLGAGGKFSSHGALTGPSRNCPPGGTF